MALPLWLCGLSQCHVSFMEQPEFFPNVPPFQNGHIYTQGLLQIKPLLYFFWVFCNDCFAGIFYASEGPTNEYVPFFYFYRHISTIIDSEIFVYEVEFTKNSLFTKTSILTTLCLCSDFFQRTYFEVLVLPNFFKQGKMI